MRSVAILLPALLILSLIPGTGAVAREKPADAGAVRLTWDILAQVSFSQEAQSYLPVFGSEVRDLEGKRVVVRGFMMARDHEHSEDRFVLSAYPMGRCFLCAPGGVTAVMEIVPRKSLKFRSQPLFMEGTLELVPEDPLGILYRVTDSVPVSGMAPSSQGGSLPVEDS